MSYTYLLEQGEESSADCFSDIPPFVLLKLSPIHEASYCNGNETASCPDSHYGTMFAHSTASLGREKLTWFAGDFPVVTYPKSSKAQKELTETNLDSGERWQELQMKCDPVTFSLKTHHSLFVEDLDESCAIFPEWGMMRNGEFWAHATLELVTLGTDFGYWATPNARDWKDTMGMSKERKNGRMKIDQTSRQVYSSVDGSGLFMPPTAPETWMSPMNYSVQNADLNTEATANALGQLWTNSHTNPEATENMPSQQTGGHLNPAFSEWLMGWPIGWTGLLPLEMDKFQRWQQSHLKFCHHV